MLSRIRAAWSRPCLDPCWRSLKSLPRISGIAVHAPAHPAMTSTAPNKDRFCPAGTNRQTSRPLLAMS